MPSSSRTACGSAPARTPRSSPRSSPATRRRCRRPSRTRCPVSRAPTPSPRSRTASSWPSATRSGSARSSSAGSATTGWLPRRRARSTSSAPSSSATCGRARSSASTPTVRTRCRRSRQGGTRSASSSTSTSRGRTRGSPGSRCTAPVSAWASGWQARRRSRRTSSSAFPTRGRPPRSAYSKASGIPFSEALIKNRYVARTFIQPDQGMREQGIRTKFNSLDEVEGQRLVVVDDSIVRGNTTRQLVAMLFDAGAAEVHVRISSPPIVVALLLRHRHGGPERARGGAPLGRGDARAHRRDLAPLPLGGRDAGGDDAARGRGLPRVLHARVPDARAGNGREAPLRDDARLTDISGEATFGSATQDYHREA